MKINIVVVLILSCMVQAVKAQTYQDSLVQDPKWSKKFYLGFAFNNGIAGITGENTPEEYFFKPGMGVAIKSEVYLHKNFAIGIGAGYQQKGSGIITQDYVSYQDDLGNGDSTHRARIKFNAVELPLTLVFRSNNVLPQTRIHLSVGVTPLKNVYSRYVMYSIEDGFHLVENHSARYYIYDMPLNGSVGIDTNVGNSCIFQAHLIGNWGTRNVYNQNSFPEAQGRNNFFGISLAWMY